MSRQNLQHLLSGLRADIQSLVDARFAVTDTAVIDNLFETMTILKMAQKTIPLHAWQQCQREYGPLRYRSMNAYLAGFMGARFKAELAVRRLFTLDEKKSALETYVKTPAGQRASLLKNTDATEEHYQEIMLWLGGSSAIIQTEPPQLPA